MLSGDLRSPNLRAKAPEKWRLGTKSFPNLGFGLITKGIRGEVLFGCSIARLGKNHLYIIVQRDFFFHCCMFQLMVSCWFGARWFGIPRGAPK